MLLSDDQDYRLYLGSCLDILPTFPDASVDLVLTDPPYAEIDRSYGRWTEDEWHAMIRPVVLQCKRILKPQGSVVMVLQPNSNKPGSMRPWLWKFMVWCCQEWNIVQDAYWWNTCAIPEAHSIQARLLRTSLKYCVWLGPIDCYRDQDSVLWEESKVNAQQRLAKRHRNVVFESKHHSNSKTMTQSAVKRGGVTPFNVLPLGNAHGSDSPGAMGHGAGTPESLCDWWIRYLSKSADIVLDPFSGTGTVGRAALRLHRRYIGIERDRGFFETSEKLLADPPLPLFDGLSGGLIEEVSFLPGME